jgi:FixJ family two-component response regulator
MPDMNGFEVLAALRALGWTGGALMLTGYYDALLAARASQEGFKGILRKPVLDHELISTVTRMLGQQSQTASM